MQEACACLHKMGDIERAVVRLTAASAGALGRDAPEVVLYEDTSKRKVRAVTALLADLARVSAAVTAFADVELTAPALAALVTWGGRMPDFRDTLAELQAATDWKQAEEAGRVVPNCGVDATYDAAVAAVQRADDNLATFLASFRDSLGSGKDVAGVKFVSVNKDSHVLEVPEALAAKVSDDFHACAGKKGVKRYSSEELGDLVAQRRAALEAVEAAQLGILQRLVAKLAADRSLWLQVRCDTSLSPASQQPAGRAAKHDGTWCRRRRQRQSSTP